MIYFTDSRRIRIKKGPIKNIYNSLLIYCLFKETFFFICLTQIQNEFLKGKIEAFIY